MAKKILIVDDEQDICEILRFNLQQAGYDCSIAFNGRDAIRQLLADTYDLILLDVMMPEMSGYELAEMIRNDQLEMVPYDLPIIFLAALGEEDDMLRGFRIGADDYIAKPFSLKLLIARVEAVLKRNNRPWSTPPEPIHLPHVDGDANKGLVVREDIYSASIDGEDLRLTKMEFELLVFLIHHTGTIFSRSDLLKQVWPSCDMVLERTVDVTITRLRKKLGDYKDHLKTKTGYGYYWEK